MIYDLRWSLSNNMMSEHPSTPSTSGGGWGRTHSSPRWGATAQVRRGSTTRSRCAPSGTVGPVAPGGGRNPLTQKKNTTKQRFFVKRDRTEWPSGNHPRRWISIFKIKKGTTAHPLENRKPLVEALRSRWGNRRENEVRWGLPWSAGLIHREIRAPRASGQPPRPSGASSGSWIRRIITSIPWFRSSNISNRRTTISWTRKETRQVCP